MTNCRRTYRVVRDLTDAERVGATDGLGIGDIVHDYKAYTHGCIESGIAVSLEPDDRGTFLELPLDAIEAIDTTG